MGVKKTKLLSIEFMGTSHNSVCFTFRREAGMCRICYSVDARTTDIGITGMTKADTANASIKVCTL